MKRFKLVGTKNIFKIIGIVTAINLASRLFGFAREMLIGYHFGTSSLADSVILAYTIPNFLYLVLGGAITTAFISIYNKISNPLHQTQFKEVIFTYITIGTTVLTIGFMLSADQIINLFFDGLGESEARITSSLFVLMTPSLLFLILSMWLSGVLNVSDRFFSSSLATLTNNFVFVALALIFFPLLGIFAYGWGAVFGALFMVVVLVYYIVRNKLFRFRLRFRYEETEHLLRMVKIGLPILLGGATLQLYFLLHRIFASELETGFVAALNYSAKLVQLPQSILMTAVTTVIYPLLAKKAAQKQHQEISSIYFKGINSLILLLAPISIYVYFYAEEIVKLVFEYGSFTEKSTTITAGLLKIFVLGMCAHAANLYVTRFYYAMERSIFPVVTGVIAVFGVNVLIIMLFIGNYGAYAIASATTISSYFQLISLVIGSIFMLKLKVGNIQYLLKVVLFILLLIPSMYLTKTFLAPAFSLINLLIGVVVLGIITALLLKVLHLGELNIRRKRKK